MGNFKVFRNLISLFCIDAKLGSINQHVASVCRNAVMFNNDLMADVHFVVGPPGGTQRLPGHKVSNSCTVFVLGGEG